LQDANRQGRSSLNLNTGFSLGDCQVRPVLHRVERDGEIHSLEPKTMAVLVCLAERSGEVVSADDLIEQIWQGRPMGDNPVYKCVAQLRRALGDDSRRPWCIETIPRRGYRLLVEVGMSAGPAPGPTYPARRFMNRYLLMPCLLLAMLAPSLILWPDTESAVPEPDAGTGPARLLLLPLESQTGNALAVVSEATLRDELQAGLARFGNLELVDFADWREGSLVETNSGPTYYLGGAMLVREGHYRLDLDLSNGADGLLWSRPFSFPLSALPATIDELIGSIAESLGAESPDGQASSSTSSACATSDSVRACQLYLMASDYLRYPGAFDQARQQAIELLEQAIELDPRFAAAHAGLALMHLAADAAAGNDRVSERGLAALEWAESLAPELPEVLAARGLRWAVDARTDCGRQCASPLTRYRNAEEDFRRALAHKPDLVQARIWLAIVLNAQGRFQEAFSQVMLALAHDPMHPMAHYQLVTMTGHSGDLAQAEVLAEQFRRGHPQGAQLMDRVLAGARMLNGDAEGSFQLLASSSRQGHDRAFHVDLPLVTWAMIETGRHGPLASMLAKVEAGECELGTVPWQRPHVEARVMQIRQGLVSEDEALAFRKALRWALNRSFGHEADWPRWGLRAKARLYSGENRHDLAVDMFSLVYDPALPELDQLHFLVELAAVHDYAESLRAVGQSGMAENLLAYSLDLIEVRRIQGQRGIPALEQLRERKLALLGRLRAPAALSAWRGAH
jgi:DNA-binding winged helix-turn-helix (wHTH) protein/tetratricopeptide (TPR) repeat protein